MDAGERCIDLGGRYHEKSTFYFDSRLPGCFPCCLWQHCSKLCCIGRDSTASSAAESTAAFDTAAADGQTYKVGICQLVQHVALDAATQGFKDALTEQLGDAVTFEEKNAQGDSNTCSTIINGFVSEMLT